MHGSIDMPLVVKARNHRERYIRITICRPMNQLIELQRIVYELRRSQAVFGHEIIRIFTKLRSHIQQDVDAYAYCGFAFSTSSNNTKRSGGMRSA